MTHNIRPQERKDYTSMLSPSGQRRTNVRDPASLTTYTTKVEKDTAFARVHDMIQIFLIRCTVVYHEKDNLPLELKRTPTVLQGASATNPVGVTPSRKNHGRHTNGIQCQAAVPSDKIQETVDKIVNNGLDDITQATLNTPQKQALERSPQRTRQILEHHFRQFSLFRNTEFEISCNRCESGLMDSNDFDKMVEYRIRPIWDDLVVELLDTNITPEALTMRFTQEYLTILTRLKERIDVLEVKLNRYFELEADPNGAQELDDLRKEILHNYSTSQNVGGLIRWRREDVLRLGVNHPTLVEGKERILKSARHLKEEVDYQHEAASNVRDCSIDDISTIHFGTNPKQAIRELLSAKTIKKRRISTDSDDDE